MDLFILKQENPISKFSTIVNEMFFDESKALFQQRINGANGILLKVKIMR